MGWWDDTKGYLGSHAGSLILGGPLGAGMQDSGLFDPRTEGQYAGVDRNNFNLPGADARGDFLRGGAQNAQTRQAPQAADSSYWAQRQMGLADGLNRTANGLDPQTLSQMALRASTDANAAQQRSMAAGASPGNAAMAQRMAMQNIGRANQGFGQQAAQLGIQERDSARAQLAGLAGQARGQDIGLNQFNAGAQLQQRGMNDAYTQGMSGLELQNAGMQQQGGISYEGNRTARSGAQMNQPTRGEEELGAFNGFLGGLHKMAKGGVVTGPTPALIGEAGPEAVIPLHKLPAILGLMGRVKTTTPEGQRPPPQKASSGKRIVLPGELAKFAPSEARKAKK